MRPATNLSISETARRSRRWLAAPAVLVGALAVPLPVGAAVCNVPQAYPTIAAAIAATACEIVVIAPGTYTERLTINRDVTINGASAQTTIIDGGAAGRVFTISSGTVHILDVTIRNGSVPATQAGAGISAGGYSGTRLYLTLTRCRITGNTAGGNGGGISFGSAAQMPTLVIEGCEISNNTTTAASGGGLIVTDGFAYIANTTISGNKAGKYGGGLWQANTQSNLWLDHVTITNNTAATDPTLSGVGGGYLKGQGFSQLASTIIAGNRDTATPQMPDCSARIVSAGYNLVGVSTGCYGLMGSDQSGTIAAPLDAGIGPLSLNGGTTQSHAPQAGSPVIDKADPAWVADAWGSLIVTDQRGLSRPVDGDGNGSAIGDVGAVEVNGRETLPGQPIYVPGAANLSGVGGIDWRTALEILNTGPVQVSYVIALLKRDQANPNPEVRTFTLDPGKAVRYENALSSLFGFTGAATLRITPSVDTVMATSRTFVGGAAGTYGQFVRGLPVAHSSALGNVVRVMQLTQGTSDTTGFRTNLGVVNVSPMTITVNVQFFRADGTALGNKSYTLEAYKSVQTTKVISGLTTADVPDAYAVLSTPTVGGRFMAFAVVVDNRTGDGVYQQAL